MKGDQVYPSSESTKPRPLMRPCPYEGVPSLSEFREYQTQTISGPCTYEGYQFSLSSERVPNSDPLWNLALTKSNQAYLSLGSTKPRTLVEQSCYTKDRLKTIMLGRNLSISCDCNRLHLVGKKQKNFSLIVGDLLDVDDSLLMLHLHDLRGTIRLDIVLIMEIRQVGT